MTFRLRHEWALGAVLTAQLATCSHCETLRVEENGETLYIKRAIDPVGPPKCRCVPDLASSCTCETDGRKGNLVLALEPPCIGPTTRFQAPW